jgi:hypothetical protein
LGQCEQCLLVPRHHCTKSDASMSGGLKIRGVEHRGRTRSTTTADVNDIPPPSAAPRPRTLSRPIVATSIARPCERRTIIEMAPLCGG